MKQTKQKTQRHSTNSGLNSPARFSPSPRYPPRRSPPSRSPKLGGMMRPVLKERSGKCARRERERQRTARRTTATTLTRRSSLWAWLQGLGDDVRWDTEVLAEVLNALVGQEPIALCLSIPESCCCAMNENRCALTCSPVVVSPRVGLLDVLVGSQALQQHDDVEVGHWDLWVVLSAGLVLLGDKDALWKQKRHQTSINCKKFSNAIQSVDHRLKI